MDPDGTKVSSRRIENSPMNLAAAVGEVGPEPEVVLEATWGWYWAADVIAEAQGRGHLAHPLGVKALLECPPECGYQHSKAGEPNGGLSDLLCDCGFGSAGGIRW